MSNANSSPSQWLTVREGLSKMQKQLSITSRKRYDNGSVASTTEKQVRYSLKLNKLV
ncbi:hypothetical protein O9853_25340 [Vibrio lentus]|nr:hypothetical protein [Vibrio lentus]